MNLFYDHMNDMLDEVDKRMRRYLYQDCVTSGPQTSSDDLPLAVATDASDNDNPAE